MALAFFFGNKEKERVDERALSICRKVLLFRSVYLGVIFAKALAGGGCSDAVASFLASD